MKNPTKPERRQTYPAGTSRTTVEHQKRIEEKKKGLPKRVKSTPEPYKPRGTPGSKDRRLR